MKTMELRNLKSGDYVQSVKTGEVLEVVGMEAGKYMLSNGKVYSESTIKRWWNIAVVEPQVEDTTQDTEEQDTTEQTNTNDLQDNTAQDNEIHEDTEQTGQQDVVEGNTATITQEQLDNITPGNWIIRKKDNSRHQITARVTETKKFGIDGHKVITFKDVQDNYILEDNTDKTGTANTGEGTIQQNNLIQSLNSLMDLHGVKMEAKKEYIKVSMEGKRGALCMIRQTRFGALHIDMKSKVFAQLTEEYRDLLIEQYDCKVYDSSRGYYRVFNCNDIEVLQTIILTAKQMA